MSTDIPSIRLSDLSHVAPALDRGEVIVLERDNQWQVCVIGAGGEARLVDADAVYATEAEALEGAGNYIDACADAEAEAALARKR